MLAFKPHKAPIFQLAFSPDGASVATSGTHPILRVSDAATGKARWEYAPPRLPMIGLGLSYSPDGTKLATVGWAVSITFDAATGEVLHQRPGSGYAIAFTPDGAGVVTTPATRGNPPFVTDLATGEARRLSNLDGVEPFTRFAFSPDGKTLAAVGDMRVTLVNFATGRLLAAETLTASVPACAALAFRPNGRTLVFSDGPKLIVFDLDSKERVAERKRSKKHIQDGAFTPDGKFFITVSNDTTAVLWETTGWTEVRAFAWDIGPLKSVSVSPDGTRAACASDRGRVVVWDLDI